MAFTARRRLWGWDRRAPSAPALALRRLEAAVHTGDDAVGLLLILGLLAGLGRHGDTLQHSTINGSQGRQFEAAGARDK
jgi:hypothetical protein